MKRKMVFLLITTIVAATLLTGCGKGSDYKEAVSLFENGQYEDAKTKFSELGDYEDSASYVIECNYYIASDMLDAGNYENAVEIFESISDFKDSASKIEEANNAIMREKYADIYTALNGNTWYFNGGADNILNWITFSDEIATVDQVTYTGNGWTTSTNEYNYEVNDDGIAVTLLDGSALTITYTMSDEALTLESDKYFTLDDIEARIQGYWTLTTTTLGKEDTVNIYFNDGYVIYENAAESIYAADSGSGRYFYYGPYEGTYTLKSTGFDTEIKNGSMFHFNIIDGDVAILYFNHVFTRSDADGLPGENGYSFS